ncbi:MAG: hypothetical protein M2R45_04988 [Verrucomicrobia subdivision 3 bacterium]|nr:hypothetical protein [Limisphaerales bacterium]MCS1415585.1 hypothetical protein [Limisphaerales bacterium]
MIWLFDDRFGFEERQWLTTRNEELAVRTIVT